MDRQVAHTCMCTNRQINKLQYFCVILLRLLLVIVCPVPQTSYHLNNITKGVSVLVN